MKAVVAAFNQEKALVGTFSVIVQLHRLIDLRHYSGDLSQVREAVAAALDCEELSIVNIMINPMAGRRAQQHEWLTRAKL